MKTHLFVCLTIFSISGLAAADQGRTEIGPTDIFPIIIDTPGSYLLTADLHVTDDGVNCFEISVDNVSLDLGGHVVRGPGASATSGYGIFAYNQSGLTLRSGTVTEFHRGVSLSGIPPNLPAGNRIFDLTVSWSVSDGLYFFGGVAREVTAHHNGSLGIGGSGVSCSRCSLFNIVADRNTTGFSINQGSAENCIAVENSHIGVSLDSSAFRGGGAHLNEGIGIWAGSASTIVGASVFDNGSFGISVGSGGHNNVVNCTGRDNGLGNITGCGDGNGCHQNYLP